MRDEQRNRNQTLCKSWFYVTRHLVMTRKTLKHSVKFGTVWSATALIVAAALAQDVPGIDGAFGWTSGKLLIGAADQIPYKYPVRDAYFTYASRGCIRKCSFCGVPKLEGDQRDAESITGVVRGVASSHDAACLSCLNSMKMLHRLSRKEVQYQHELQAMTIRIDVLRASKSRQDRWERQY